MRLIACIIMVMIAVGTVWADDRKAGGDDFFSSTISDVFTKVNKYMSGEQDVLLSQSERINNEEKQSYDKDPLGRRVPTAVTQSGRLSTSDDPFRSQ